MRRNAFGFKMLRRTWTAVEKRPTERPAIWTAKPLCFVHGVMCRVVRP